MKIRRLSEIDLARIAPLASDEKKIRLRSLKVTFPPHTYYPMRSQLGDILNMQSELFPLRIDFTPWKYIESAINKKATSEVEARFNLAAAKGLYDFCVENGIRSFAKSILPWNVGFGQTVKYWWNLYSVIGDKATFVFPDPRISNPLTKSAIRFVISMMNQRLRVDDIDFVDARLCVAQFTKGDDGARYPRLVEVSETDLYSADELNQMIEETYRYWIEVLNERLDEVRARPTGTTPFGF